MKNLIAISAVALTAASANAAVVATDDNAVWTTGFAALYTNETFYVDTLNNATMSGSSVTGGHGWGQYTVTSTNVTSALSITGTGAGTNIVSTPLAVGNDNYINFNFANSSGPAGGLYGIGIYFTIDINPSDPPAPLVTATFAGSGNSNTWDTFVVDPGVNFIGFYSSNSARIVNLSLQFGSDVVITVQALELGLVPAPGAVALLGAAGLVGSRRRRA